MKVKIVTVLFFSISQICISQIKDTIHGRIISSITRSQPHGIIYIYEKGTHNGTITDSLGIFSLIPEKPKKQYELEISADSYNLLYYVYKSEWAKRKRPKSIVIEAICDVGDPKTDWNNKSAKLYIIGGIAPKENTRRDKRFERRYNIEYFDFGCESKVYECLEEYNKGIIFRLDLKYGNKWREKVRNDIIGL